MEVCCNQITLKQLQNILGMPLPIPNFLRLIFPKSLYDTEKTEFIFDNTPSYTSHRSVFVNSNIKNGSRANKNALIFIAEQFKSATAFQDIDRLLRKNFSLSQLSSLPSIIDLDYELYPNDFYIVLKECAKADLHHLLLWLVLWSVFGEKIILLAPYQYDKNNPSEISSSENITTPNSRNHPIHPDDFFKSYTDNLSAITNIDLILCYEQKSDGLLLSPTALDQYVQQGITINILLAPPSVRDNTIYSRRFLQNYDHIINQWLEYMKEHIQFVTIKGANGALRHNYISFNMIDPSQDGIFIKFLSADDPCNPSLQRNFHQALYPDSPHFSFFKQKFSYLWSISRPPIECAE